LKGSSNKGDGAGTELCGDEFVAGVGENSRSTGDAKASFYTAIDPDDHIGGNVIGTDWSGGYRTVGEETDHRRTEGVWVLSPPSKESNISPIDVNEPSDSYEKREIKDDPGLSTRGLQYL